ncbi:MAG: hypothetical protein JSS66_05795 [Armatimonadetes bacterium]|nr:hypothetical protein [Armatimonadota bacterium]
MLQQIKNARGPWLSEQDGLDYVTGEGNEDLTGVKLVMLWGEMYLRQLFVIAEMYEKKKFGRVKRRYLAEFDEAERAVISKWYLRIYAWYLVTGIPVKGVRMTPKTYGTLLKAANFFATV